MVAPWVPLGMASGVPGSGTPSQRVATLSLRSPHAFPVLPKGMLWERRDLVFLSQVPSLDIILVNCSFSLSLFHISVALYPCDPDWCAVTGAGEGPQPCSPAGGSCPLAPWHGTLRGSGRAGAAPAHPRAPAVGNNSVLQGPRVFRCKKTVG